MSRIVKSITIKSNKNEIIKAVTGKQLAAAALAGAKVIESAAKNNAPKDTGELQKSIVTVPAKSEAKLAEVDVGSNLVYARITEIGGTIKAKSAKNLNFTIGGAEIFTKAVHILAHPYLRPAVDQNTDRIEQAIADSIRKDIEGAAGK